jgi:cyanophycin synthetase
MQLLIKKARQIKTGSISEVGSDLFKGTVAELVRYALKKNIKVYQLFEGRIIFALKRGNKIVWIHRALTSKSNPIGVNIARNKNLTKLFLKKLGYPIPEGILLKEIAELKKIINKIKFPAVVKPLSAAEGKGITVNIRDKKLLASSFQFARQYDDRIIIENHLSGNYYRLTYIADGSFAATENLPAYIVGDGINSAEKLIYIENKTPERSKSGRLKKIKLTEKTKRFLASEGYSLNSIIPKNKQIPLCFSGYDGGEYIDVTEKIHPYYIKLAQDITANLLVPIVGIDIITKDITRPLTKTGGAVIEINGTFPDIQFHNNPTIGKPRNLAPKLINYLFKIA